MLKQQTATQAKRRRFPRRSRRGAGLVEVALGLFVTASIVTGVVQFITQDKLDELNQMSAREVSIVADAAEAFALTNFDQVAALIAAEPLNFAEVDPAVLEAAGFLNTRTPITAFKDPITIFYVSDQPDVIVAFAVARRDLATERTYTMPRPEPGIRDVGVNPRGRAGLIIGYGFQGDLANANRNLRTDGLVSTGSMAGVRTISFATDINPYLHRIAVPGRPELNRMEADLDMAGRSITGVDLLQSDAIDSGAFEITNTLTAGDATFSGDLNVNGPTTIIGDITGGDATFTGRLDAATAAITGEMRTASMVADSITSANATFTQSLSANTLVTTILTTDTLSADALNANNVAIQQITADTLILSDGLTAGEGFINQITTGSCTGC